LKSQPIDANDLSAFSFAGFICWADNGAWERIWIDAAASGLLASFTSGIRRDRDVVYRE
jgi:hypothetical protein